MIKNGFRLYKDEEGELRLDQIVDGQVFDLIPKDEIKKMPLGYYDPNFKRLEKA